VEGKTGLDRGACGGEGGIIKVARVVQRNGVKKGARTL